MAEQPATHDDQPIYTPGPDEQQFSARALIAGCMLGAVVCAMNIYFGLKTGWGIGGSLIAAILSFSLFRGLSELGIGKPLSTLETNIAQTAASGAGSMTSAAGLLGAIPAMGMLGYELSYFELTIWAASVATLGIFYAVPLRRQMVLVEKLRFPTGTATAETILAMQATGDEAAQKSRFLVGFGLLAAGFTVLVFGAPTLAMPPLHDWLPVAALGTAAAYGFTIYINPLMFGAGILIGPRVAVSLLLGAIASWAILAPTVEMVGWVDGATMSYASGSRGWILWPGVAIMVADALTSLALSWRTILNTFRTTGDGEAAADVDAAEAIPNAWWIGGLCASGLLTVVASKYLFDINPLLTALAVALSSVLAAIAVRSTGETDINPIGGMGKVTQLVYGGIAPGSIPTNLMAAAVTGAGASQAGDMMQDLKTGWLLGASPRKQMVAQLAGVFVGIFVCVPIYVLFDTVYEIGGDSLPAPAAHAWKAMAELLSVGLEALPANAEIGVACGLAFGVALPVIRSFLPKEKKDYVPSALAFGIAFIVPAFYGLSMFMGAAMFFVWGRVNKKAAAALGFAVASGLIAGEGLTGVLVALAQFGGIPEGWLEAMLFG